jgi:hypothetical protein
LIRFDALAGGVSIGGGDRLSFIEFSLPNEYLNIDRGNFYNINRRLL